MKPLTTVRLHRLLVEAGLRPEEVNRVSGEVIVRVELKLPRPVPDADLVFRDVIIIFLKGNRPLYVTMGRAEWYGVCSPADVALAAAFHKRLAEIYAIVSGVLSSLEK